MAITADLTSITADSTTITADAVSGATPSTGCPPQRWDSGQWDEAVWNGQLCIEAQTAQVVITPQSATLTPHYGLRATTATILISPQSAGLKYSRAIHAETLPIVVNPLDAELHLGLVMEAGSATITIDPDPAGLGVGIGFQINYHLIADGPLDIIVGRIWAELVDFRQPTLMKFGVQRVIVPRRRI